VSFSCNRRVFQEAFLHQHLQVSVDLGITELCLVHDVCFDAAPSSGSQDFSHDVVSVSAFVAVVDANTFDG
jgi:hypothetical protein